MSDQVDCVVVPKHVVAEYQKEISYLRAANTELVEALREIEGCHMYSTRPWDIARATLAKAEGKNNDR